MAPKWLETIGKSATSLGPLDAVFAGLDYMDGRQQGEDRIRAGLGAGGSAAGGWGGATAGAAIGTALLPGVGTAAGAIIGGMGGSFAGGWGADRLDEAVRGKNSNGNSTRNAIAGAAGLGAAGYGVSKLAGKNMTNALTAYETGRLAGLNPWEAAGAAGRGQAEAAGAAARRMGRRVPWRTLGAAGAAVGAGVVANNLMGNPVGKALGQGDEMGSRYDSRYDNADPTIKDRVNEARALTGFGTERERQDYINQQFNDNNELKYKRQWQYDDYFNRMEYSADQARDLLDSYNQGMERAVTAAGVVTGGNFLR